MKLIKIITYSLLCFFSYHSCQAKVLIFTFAYNQPEFIELQHKLFKKFLRDDYEFIVFDDSKDTAVTNQIYSVCEKCHIKHIKIPQRVHDRPYLNRPKKPWYIREHNAPSVRNCNVVQYALDILGLKHDNLLILLESDVFLIKEFSFVEYMQNCDLAGYDRSIEYKGKRNTLPFLWIGLIYLNMATLPHKQAININCGIINNIVIDSGGYLYYYLNKIPTARKQFFKKVRIEDFICKNCKVNHSYTCNHNTELLREKEFDERTIHFIQEVPIDWGSAATMPNGSPGALIQRNLEFLHNNNFVHFYGASGYANNSPNCDIAQFYKDKTNAFKKYITTILEH